MKLIQSAAFALTISTVAIVVAGCGSTAGSGSQASAGGGSTALTSGSQSPSPGSGSSTSPGGSSPGAAGSLTGNVDVCSLMPVATIAKIVGKPLDMAQRDDTPSYQQYGCNYTDKVTSSGGGDQLELGIEGLDASQGYAADLSAMSSQARAVAGIGDKAFTAGLLAQLEVLYGDVLIKITGLTAPTIGQGKQIISDLHARL